MANITSNDVEWTAHVVIMPIILLVGFFGQILNLITLHQPRLKGVTFLYLKAVAFAEFFSILTLVPFVIRHAYEDVDVEWPCWILFYSAHFEIPLANAFMTANTLSIVGLTIERYLSVCHPLWALKAGTPKRARLVIAALYLTAFALFVPSAFQKVVEYAPKNVTMTPDPQLDTSPGGEPFLGMCTEWTVSRNHALHGLKSFKMYLLFRELLARIGPTVVLIILNIAMFRAVRRTSSKRRSLVSMKRFSTRRRSSRQRRPGFVKQPKAGSGSGSGSGSAIETDPTGPVTSGDEPSPTGDQSLGMAQSQSQGQAYSDNRTLVIRYRRTRREKNDHERQRRVYVLLVVTVLTFLICTIPASILSLLVTDRNTDEDTLGFQAFRAAANLLEVVSFSINFYIYCLCSEDYRKMFLKWLHRCVDEINRWWRDR